MNVVLHYRSEMLLLELLSLATVVSAMINEGYDRFGFDLPGMPIILDVCSDESQCSALCYARDDCEAWAYNLCGGGECWLKSAVPIIIMDECRVSLIPHLPPLHLACLR